jgi:hypothetical protein
MRKSLKVTEGQTNLKSFEEGERSLKGVGEIQRRCLSEFYPTIWSRNVGLAQGQSKRLENEKESRKPEKAAGRRIERRSTDAEWD